MGYADMAREGAWPMTGGVMDQSRWFVDFCATYWAEMDIAKAKTGHGH